MPARANPISDAERDLLKVLWEHGSGTLRQISEHLPPKRRRWAYTTVMTLLARLETKGYVVTNRDQSPHVYHAAVSQADVVRRQLADLAADFCDGSRAPLMLALVENGRFTADEIERFRQLIDDLETRKKGRK